jgi:acyl carrier protein
MQDIKTVVREFLLDNFVMGSDAVIADDVSFMKTHILDSTGFIELVTFIEETFGIKVADEEMVPENLDSLLNIEAYLERKGATLANT